MLTFSIGDVHGCYDQLVELIQYCRDYAKDRPHRFLFIGDYIDRGPNSRGVVEFLIKLGASEPNPPICLRGNHEEMLRDVLTNTAAEVDWIMTNGGDATLESYGVTTASELPPEHLHWLTTRPLTFDDGQRLFVHAGVDPARPLDQQRKDDLLWIREPFLSFEGDLGRLIVHGHTPTANRRPDLRPNRINLDTGAFLGGPLTAAIFVPEVRNPVGFLNSTHSANSA